MSAVQRAIGPVERICRVTAWFQVAPGVLLIGLSRSARAGLPPPPVRVYAIKTLTAAQCNQSRLPSTISKPSGMRGASPPFERIGRHQSARVRYHARSSREPLRRFPPSRQPCELSRFVDAVSAGIVVAGYLPYCRQAQSPSFGGLAVLSSGRQP